MSVLSIMAVGLVLVVAWVLAGPRGSVRCPSCGRVLTDYRLYQNFWHVYECEHCKQSVVA